MISFLTELTMKYAYKYILFDKPFEIFVFDHSSPASYRAQRHTNSWIKLDNLTLLFF